MSSEIRHIVFDIGKVLLHYDPELAYLDRIKDQAERHAFLNEVCSPAWNIEQDRGRDWRTAEAELIVRFPEHEENIRAYRANWHKMVPHAIDDSVVIMQRLLDGGHDVTLLSNFAADTFAEACRRFGFLSGPRGATISAHVGLLKPDRAIYDAHTATFGLDACATLFIDDSPANVTGARDAGWQAVQFTDPERLKADLAGYRLRPSNVGVA